jgi:RNA polymerase sigma-70 factor, ECF subfamily
MICNNTGTSLKRQDKRFDSRASQRLNHDDIQIFEDIFRQYFQRLYEFSCFIVGDQQAAEDIVQDIFFYFWEHRTESKSHTNIASLLFTAVKNKSLNYKRHRKIEQKHKNRKVAISGTLEMPDAKLEYRELEMAINEAIDELPEKRRVIFYLHRFENLTYTEIANILGISIKTVETQMNRSLKHLEKRLAKFLLVCF